MIHNAYTLYDRKALVYSPPFFAVADGAAVRMVQDLASTTDNQVGRDYIGRQLGLPAHNALRAAAGLVSTARGAFEASLAAGA